MRIIKCDNCKKVIDGQSITAGFGPFPSVELCVNCGKPILKILKKYGLLSPEKEKQYLK